MLNRFLVHNIFFGLKRAHHGTLRITRKLLAAFGLTAARFDLLYAVKKERRGILQSALRKVLGVSRATVSRMLASLEELGLVRRTFAKQDRRGKSSSSSRPRAGGEFLGMRTDISREAVGAQLA